MRKLNRSKNQEAKHLTLEAAAMASGGYGVRFNPYDLTAYCEIGPTSVGSGGTKGSATTSAGASGVG